MRVKPVGIVVGMLAALLGPLAAPSHAAPAVLEIISVTYDVDERLLLVSGETRCAPPLESTSNLFARLQVVQERGPHRLSLVTGAFAPCNSSFEARVPVPGEERLRGGKITLNVELFQAGCRQVGGTARDPALECFRNIMGSLKQVAHVKKT